MSDSFDSASGGFDSNEQDADQSGQSDQSDSIWDSDEAFESLTMERSLHADESNEQLTRRLLEEAAPSAAQSIIHIALHSGNDNTRLNAAKYITDKLLDDESSTTKAKWEEMVGEVVDQAELYANESSGS